MQYDRKIGPSMRECKRMSCALNLKSVDAAGRFAGYASVFNVLDNQKDIILRGAFADTIKGRVGEIKLLWQHQMDEPIGVFNAMFEDGRGLYVEGQLLLSVARAREALALLKAGAISGLSIGYSPLRYTIDPETGVRKLAEVELWEVSLVTFPANEQAGVTVVKSARPATAEELAWLGIAATRGLEVLGDVEHKACIPAMYSAGQLYANDNLMLREVRSLRAHEQWINSYALMLEAKMYADGELAKHRSRRRPRKDWAGDGDGGGSNWNDELDTGFGNDSGGGAPSSQDAFGDVADDNTDTPDTWGRPETFNDHYERHGDDFGAESPDDYAAQASQFLQDAQENNSPALLDRDGNIRLYDEESNTFGAYNPDHTTRSFYKPDEGPDYFATETDKILNKGGQLINGEDIPEPVLDEPFIPEIPLP